MSALDDVIQYHAENCQSGSECDLSALSRAELERMRQEIIALRSERDALQVKLANALTMLINT